VFGPIWSCDVGHHLSTPTEDGPIGIFDGVLKPWEHLTATPEQIYARLEPRLGAKTPRLIRRKAPRPAPAGGVASRTRGQLWVAKNGRPSPAEKACAAAGFTFGFASTRLCPL
jgi:hypothetical protein